MKIRVSNSLFVILVSAVLWQPVSAAADSYDPPARVARLSYSRGSVSFQPAGDSEWVDAVLNLPIVTGDNLWAGENSRAEVRIGSKAIRLDHDTEISFLTITDQHSATPHAGLAHSSHPACRQRRPWRWALQQSRPEVMAFDPSNQ